MRRVDSRRLAVVALFVVGLGGCGSGGDRTAGSRVTTFCDLAATPVDANTQYGEPVNSNNPGTIAAHIIVAALCLAAR